jgi:aldehyde dehydrogenase (NAD+)
MHEIVERQRSFFSTGATKNILFRVEQLKRLRQIVEANQAEIMAALKADMNKPEFEAYTSEILLLISEINYTLKHLKSWAKPKRVRTPLSLFLASSQIYTEPLGVVLIIGPWNYPFQLAIAPLIGAIAAGNCAVIKPSEIAPHTSQIIAKLIGENFQPEFISVVEGGIETNQSLLAEKFDRIFFTGGTSIGKIVMAAAAQHLTPVTLELGGKSPCIVDAEVDLDLAVKRIIWGKFMNAGQTCVAPDYVLASKAIKPALLAKIQQYTQEFYGDDPQQSPDYARIINDKQFHRLTGLLPSVTGEGKIVTGGNTDASSRYIAPTVLDKVSTDSKVMADEIFGPILPILEYEDLSEAIAFVNARPKPLALYFFSTNKHHQARIIQETSSGGCSINETITHLTSPELPFGGVGHSGMGSYHGKASFDTFSHQKSVLNKSFLVDVAWRYPPYKLSPKILRWLT